MLQPASPDRRIPALDGFRGLMTLFVVGSHYFAEIRGGVPQAGVGFVAVDGFFVLSGLLVGRLVLDRGKAANFLQVFYIRRVCRTFPIYGVCVAIALLLGLALGLPDPGSIPGWSYFGFVSNIFAAAHDDVGREWLSPTWTMAVEEQFYLVAPALMLMTPRRHLPGVLGCIVAGAILVRLVLALCGISGIAALILLPTRADNLAIGLACALLLRTGVRWDATAFRAAPIGLLAGLLALRLVGGPTALTVAGHTVLCSAVALFLMGLVRGAPEARRFEGRALAFFGATSYATYLTHMPVLWTAHALILHAVPSLATGAGVLVTLFCIPVTVGLSVVLTRLVEAPITAFGRRFRFAGPKGAPAIA